MDFLWVAVVLLAGQLPVYLARDSLRALVDDIASSAGHVLRMAAITCKSTSRTMSDRNREVLLIEHETRTQHNLEQKFSRLRDAHLRELASLPDYMRKVEDIEATAREGKLVVKHVAKLSDLTRKLEEGAEKVLKRGYELDAWVKRMKLDEETSERVLRMSLYRTLITATITVIIAALAAFVNFNLIALPMGELVPADQMVAGVSVATISAGVIVLLELIVGVFLLEAMGITHLFGFETMARWQVRIIGVVAFLGLLFLASTEATLAVLREEIVAAEAALKSDLAGAQTGPERSLLPLYGQAALGFALPWIIAMVGIPLELAIESSRQLAGRAMALAVMATGIGFQFSQHGALTLGKLAGSLLDVYVAIPAAMVNALRRRE